MASILARLAALEGNPRFSTDSNTPSTIVVKRGKTGGYVAHEIYVVADLQPIIRDVPLTDWRDYEPPPGYRESGKSVIFLVRRGASDGPFSDVSPQTEID